MSIVNAQTPASGVAPTSSGYIPRLDTFRAIAALSIVYLHYFTPFLPPQLQFRMGFGVPFFFVLSGYLITGMLLDVRAEPASLARGQGRAGWPWRKLMGRPAASGDRTHQLWDLYLAQRAARDGVPARAFRMVAVRRQNALLVVTFIVAALSYRFLEQPLRSLGREIARRTVSATNTGGLVPGVARQPSEAMSGC
jgi:peptidoglycan/LPS O-acetylase OafA/YrhL